MRGIYAQERKRNEEIWWMKVIFLDIDGVLNSSKTIGRNFDYPELDPRNLKVLKDIVELSHAVIVLISSWKL